MTISSLPNLDLARDANFSTLMGLARPPAIGTISGARLTNGQYNVEFDGSDGGETIAAWPVNAIEYRDGDVVWILFLSASTASGVILGRNSPAPVAMAVHSHTSELDDRYGRLAGSNAWAGANAFALAPSALWWDQAMGSDADNDPFDGNASGTPAGWTQVVAPYSSTTAAMRGFWRITGTSDVTAWKYRKPLAGWRDTTWDSVQWGPVMFRDGRWAGDVSYLFGIYKDNSGTIDENTFLRVNLTYDNAVDQWKVRAERKDGTTQTNGAWFVLSQHPVVQPLWLRQVVYKGATSNTLRCYLGSTGIAAAQTLLVSASSTFAWGNALWAQVELAGRPASGVDDTVSVGGVERAVAA